MRRRAGRKRKDCLRHANGRAVKGPDLGTVELRQRRRALAGAGGDPTMTTDPLDILVDRGLIGADAARAATWFRRLAIGFLGRTHPKSCLNLDPAADPDPERVARLTRAYDRLARRLTAAERALLLDVFFFAHVPGWLAKMLAGLPLTAADAADRLQTLTAVGSLVSAWLRPPRG